MFKIWPISRLSSAVMGRTRRGIRRLRYRLLKPILGKPSSLRQSVNGKALMGLTVADSPSWAFHDERWDHIVHRWEYRAKLARGEALELDDSFQPFSKAITHLENGQIAIESKAETTDEWIYLYVDPARHSWQNFSWKVRFRCHTNFKELQFGFRYRNFYNRYRYRFQSGRLAFDMVVNGQFIADLSSTSFPLELGREYALEIRVVGQTFQCLIDGAIVSEDYDEANLFPSGSIAIIFWEDDGFTDISAELIESKVSSLL